MSGDGNGWQFCRLGHRHWGRFGAAGILVTDGTRVLLQHRAAWTHEGDSWAVPGGARDSHEDAIAAALREAGEETSLDPDDIHPVGEWVDDHGGWAYTTIVAELTGEPEVRSTNPESDAMAWWEVDAVPELVLHSGFRAAWPALRRLVEGLAPTDGPPGRSA
jgi:8-oxo-dGTP diphosphatase